MSVVIDLREFHPGRRTPRRGEQGKPLASRLRFLDGGKNVFSVSVDGEMRHFIVAIYLVVAIPALGKVIRADRQSAKREATSALTKKIVINLFSLLLGQGCNRTQAKLAEARAKAVKP